MHIAFVDSNAAALEALGVAKDAGHEVTFVQSSQPLYPPTQQNRRLEGRADRIIGPMITTDAQAVTAALAVCHAEHPIDVVTTQHEMAAESVAAACRALGLRGTSPAAVETARRKDRCRAVLAAAGLPSARYALALDEAGALEAAAAIGYPVILKPPSGGDSLLVSVARTPAQVSAGFGVIKEGLAAVPAHWHGQFTRGVLVEELLTGTLVSVEIGARDGEFFPFCVTGRFRWVEDEAVELGSFIPADLPAKESAECVEYGIAVCRALGLDLGVFHLEMMVTERGPVLVEANPRVMGGALPTIYRDATGLDIYDHLVRLLTPGAVVDAAEPVAGCTGGRKVMARSGGVLARDASLRAVAGEPAVLRSMGFENYGVGPGQPVVAGQVLARFILREPDYATVVQTAERILRGLEKDLGVELMIGEKDGS